MKRSILVGGATILVVAFAALAVYLLANKKSSQLPVPASWTVVSQTGSIASPCLGAWEECGNITTAYSTQQSATDALAELRRSLASAGWELILSSDTQRFAKAEVRDRPSNWTQIGYIELTDGQATVKYVREQ
jgi:hypothetical protein